MENTFETERVCLSVTDFVEVVNQNLEYSYSELILEGELASFKINQDKYVFFDLKDEGASVACFMMKFALKFPLRDGMKIRVRANPKLTVWGKFSLTVLDMLPVGEGTIKKSFKLLKQKLKKEGLFDNERKRPLIEQPKKIGVISSVQAAGYADFCKILDERWADLLVQTAHCQVQGLGAVAQIIKALHYFNEQSEVDVIVIIRGGGSADDLAIFNDEDLVRAIAVSKIRVLTGIGHEIDESLCDLAADVRASTPSNAAQMLTGDKVLEKKRIFDELSRIATVLLDKTEETKNKVKVMLDSTTMELVDRIEKTKKEVLATRTLLDQLNPDRVMKRGYAILRGELSVGKIIKIKTIDKEIKAEVKNVTKRKSK